MKRFLMLVGVAVVAAAMYVAASPAGQRSAGPTAKQFKALKAQVASLSKKLKATKSESDAAVAFIGGCLVSSNAGVVGVSQFGNPSATPAFGYHYTDGTTESLTSALDADGSATPGAFLQAVDPACVQSSLRHRASHAGSSGLVLRGERFH